MKNTGGPAFPAHPSAMGDHDGMTLRDYFAAKAMQGLLSAWGQHDVTGFDELACDAYAMADAMLKERNNGQA